MTTTTTECTCYVTEHYRTNDPTCPVHRDPRSVADDAAAKCRAEAVRTAESNRKWLAGCDEMPTVTDLAAPFVGAVDALSQLADRAHSHIEVLDAFDYVVATDAERADARALLATMHALADTVASTCREWLVIDARQDQVSAAMRTVLYVLMGTEDLARAVTDRDRQALR
ncbi:hypothetical protein BH24ACT5_BH24ACT5_20080 [soil metagenome]